MKYKAGWLTINRACNIRCKWCYAQGTGFNKKDDIDINLAYNLIDIFKDLDLKSVCLLGGEPTLYDKLPELLQYIKSKGMKSTIITNGILLSNEEYLNKLLEYGLNNIVISLKAENTEKYHELTQSNDFEKVIKAIKICSQKKVNLSVSTVLTKENINSYTEGILNAKKAGAKRFNLSFCYEFNINKEYNDYLKRIHPKEIIKGFINSYEELDKITNHNFKLFQTYPLCLWDKNFIKKLDSKKQISSICQLLKRSGLLFDTKGNIIPCNAMYEIKLGQYGVDFNNKKELLEHVNNSKITKVYDKFCSVPDEKCLLCKSLSNCGGGCVCQWTNYNYKELMSKEK